MRRERAGGRAGDPFAELIDDHRRVEQLFTRIEDADGEERQRLVDEVAATLRLLLARAKKAGIEGTSSMTKAELAEARPDR